MGGSNFFGSYRGLLHFWGHILDAPDLGNSDARQRLGHVSRYSQIAACLRLGSKAGFYLHGSKMYVE